MATSNQKRVANNVDRLKKVSPSIRPNVIAVLAELEAAGYQPQIDAQVWRSPAQQAKLKAEGKSTVSYSYHNATTAGGTPDSLAVDIVDVRWQWNAPNSFWLRLAAAAERHGLASGIYWGLSTAQRAAISKAIAEKNWNAKVVLGWDTAHVEPANFTIAKAKAGQRPKLPKPKAVTPPRLFIRSDAKNSTEVKGARLEGPDRDGNFYWVAAEELELALALGSTNQPPAADKGGKVSALLSKWGWVNVKYTNQIETKNRADLYVKKKVK